MDITNNINDLSHEPSIVNLCMQPSALEDIRNLILAQFNIATVTNLGLVSKQWLQITRNNELWKQIALAFKNPLGNSKNAFIEIKNYIVALKNKVRNTEYYESKERDLLQITTIVSIADLGNYMTKRDESIFVKNLKTYLNLTHGRTFDKIAELSLVGCQLRTLPLAIGQLTSLGHLSLTSNRLENLPSTITRLAKLGSIFLNDNYFRALPQEVFSLTQLCCLAFENNFIKNIPADIGHLRQLEHIHACSNYIKKWPIEASNLHKLKDLWLGCQKCEDSWQDWFEMVILRRQVQIPFTLPLQCKYSIDPRDISWLHKDDTIRKKTLIALSAFILVISLGIFSIYTKT